MLLSKLKTQPTLYAYEMAVYLHETGFRVFSVSQIWQGLNSRNITRKVLEVHAKEQNEKKRQNFLRITSIYTAEQQSSDFMLMRGKVSFYDNCFYSLTLELMLTIIINSHITEKAIRRRYGRSPRNVTAYIYQYNRLGHRGMSV